MIFNYFEELISLDFSSNNLPATPNLVQIYWGMEISYHYDVCLWAGQGLLLISVVACVQSFEGVFGGLSTFKVNYLLYVWQEFQMSNLRNYLFCLYLLLNLALGILLTIPSCLLSCLFPQYRV